MAQAASTQDENCDADKIPVGDLPSVQIDEPQQTDVCFESMIVLREENEPNPHNSIQRPNYKRFKKVWPCKKSSEIPERWKFGKDIHKETMVFSEDFMR